MRNWKRKVGPTINYSGAPGRSDRRYNLAMTNEGWNDLDTLRRRFPEMSIAQIITNALRLQVSQDPSDSRLSFNVTMTDETG